MLKVLKKILKIIGYVIGSILLLLIIIALLLQTPPVQEFVKDKAVSFMQDKIQTEFRIGNFRLDFPYDVVVEDVYIEDQKGDTLAYLDRLRVEAEMWGLFKGQLSISDVQVDGLVGYLSRNETDSAFNFQFIADAFAPADTTAVADTTKKSMFTISVDEVHVTASRFYYTDPIEGIDMNYAIGNLDVIIDEFDLENSVFGVGSVALKDSKGKFTITKEVAPSEEDESKPAEPIPLELDVEDVMISNVQFNFESIPDEIKLLAQIGELEGQLETLDLNNMTYRANELALRNSLVDIDIFGASEEDSITNTPPTALDTVVLNAGARLVTFSNVDFSFDDHTAPEMPGFDPMHFAFTDINAKIENPDYTLRDVDNYASGEVISLTLKEEAGLALEKFNGIAEFTPKHILAKDIDLVAGNSEIHGDFKMTYESLESLAENPASMGLQVDLAPTVINLNDVVYFVPDMQEQIRPLPASAKTLRLTGEISGELASLNINNFQLDGLRNTHINITGQLAGIPDVNNLNVDMRLHQFKTTRVDIQAILPDTLLPENITIPEKLSVKGRLAGNMRDATGDLSINTSLGNASIDASLQMSEDSVFSYNGTVAVSEFNVGKLLQQEDQFGKLTANITADGEGFTVEDINTKLEGSVSAFTYNNYMYEDLEIDGHIFKQEFSGALAMDDENLDFSFEGTVDMNDSIPAFMFYLDLNNADLQALNFTEEDFQIQGTIDSDLRAKDLRQISGKISIEDVVINKANQKYEVDSLIFTSVKSGRDTELTINSDILTANFEGEFEVLDLPAVVQAHVNQYYQLLDTTSIQGIEPQSFTFNINLKDTDLITEVLVPDLESLTPGEISGSYNSANWEMEIKVEFIEIDYAGMVIDSLNISIKSDEEELIYDARVATFQSGVIPIENIWFEGVVANNHINTGLHIQDEQDQDKYLIGGIFTSWQEQYYQFQLTPDRLILDYENWDVYPGNSIQFYPSGILIEDMQLSHNEQQLTAATEINNDQDTLINIGFNNFSLSTLGNLAEQDSTFVSGLLNGEFNLNTSETTLAFTSDLSIRHLALKADTLGNLSINAYTSDADRYDVTASLDGRDNMVLIEGYYEADSVNGILNFDADVSQLSFSTIEAFSMGQLSQSRGNITADLQIRGNVNDPDIRGNIGFEEAYTNVTFLGTFLLIDDQQIQFDKQGLHFNNFTINDASGNDFNIDGDILTANYQSFDLNLNASMDDFLMMNTGAGDNPLVYGTLIVDADIRVRGDSDMPIINMDINLDDESRVTYILPESEMSTIEREGLIEFVDRAEMESGQDSLVALEQSPSDTLETNIQGMQLTANIDVNRSNSITVVIDPATGDRLSNLRGDANLALSFNPTGDITLNGRYTVYEGTYMMRFFGLARREFDIVEGSYMLWTGDPLGARMDIRARYSVEASPEPILAGSYPIQPFLVYLDLEGELLSPEISFQLSMPEDEQRSDIMSALQDINNRESELLEQVLSLVVFRRFMQESFFAGSGGGAEATARQSVSRILSQQLNQLGSQIQGVDLSFDVQSYQDYSQTGNAYNRTEVELGVSKAFLDDRLNVKVAGNFDVEGERTQQQNNLSDFAGDIVIEYMITEDGRFRLTAFRKNEYDNLLQGEIVETGVGVIFIREYDSLTELFNGLNNQDGG